MSNEPTTYAPFIKEIKEFMQHLWLMHSFFVEYAKTEFLQPMVAELKKTNLPPLVADISWTKNIVIIQKCKDPLERIFYIKATRRFGWTKDVLINNIENKAYERYLTK